MNREIATWKIIIYVALAFLAMSIASFIALYPTIFITDLWEREVGATTLSIVSLFSYFFVTGMTYVIIAYLVDKLNFGRDGAMAVFWIYAGISLIIVYLGTIEIIEVAFSPLSLLLPWHMGAGLFTLGGLMESISHIVPIQNFPLLSNGGLILIFTFISSSLAIIYHLLHRKFNKGVDE